MEHGDWNQRTEQETQRDHRAQPARVGEPCDADGDGHQRRREDRPRLAADVEVHRVDRHRIGWQQVPYRDRLGVVAAARVDPRHGRATVRQSDQSPGDESGLRPNRGHVARAEHLEHHRKHSDLTAEQQRRARADQRDADDSRDDRACLRFRDQAAPQKSRNQLGGDARDKRDPKHLHRG